MVRVSSLADYATGSALTSSHSLTQAPKKEGDAAAAPTTTQGPGAREGEHVFGVARILASFNDTFVYVPSAVQRSKAVVSWRGRRETRPAKKALELSAWASTPRAVATCACWWWHSPRVRECALAAFSVFRGP
jgi:ribosomal protein S11